MIHYYRYLFVKKNVFNYSELHFSEVTSYKIHTLGDELQSTVFVLFDKNQTNLLISTIVHGLPKLREAGSSAVTLSALQRYQFFKKDATFCQITIYFLKKVFQRYIQKLFFALISSSYCLPNCLHLMQLKYFRS